MQPTKISLDVLKIDTPCQRPWADMTGDDASRFCDHCQLKVHNLSAMTMSDAQRVLCNSAGRLCVRYELTPDGQLKTLDYAAPRPRRGLRQRTFIALTSVLTLAATGANVLLFGKAIPVAPAPTPPAPTAMLGGIRAVRELFAANAPATTQPTPPPMMGLVASTTQPTTQPLMGEISSTTQPATQPTDSSNAVDSE